LKKRPEPGDVKKNDGKKLKTLTLYIIEADKRIEKLSN